MENRVIQKWEMANVKLLLKSQWIHHRRKRIRKSMKVKGSIPASAKKFRAKPQRMGQMLEKQESAAICTSATNKNDLDSRGAYVFSEEHLK